MRITQILTPRFKRIFLPAFIAVVLLTIAMPKTARFGYDYRKGSPWKYEDLVAQMDFPIYKTDDQLVQERLDAGTVTVPYYRMSDQVRSDMLDDIGMLPLSAGQKYELSALLGSIYDRGVAASAPESELIYIQKGKRADKYPSSEIHVVKDATELFLAALRRIAGDNLTDSLLNSRRLELAPNLVYDKETTDLVSSAADLSVSPTLGYVSSGSLIVSEGELVTAEVAQILDSYKREYEHSLGFSRSGFLQWMGGLVISLCLVLLLLVTIQFTFPAVLSGWRRYSYIMTVFTLCSTVTLLVSRFMDMWVCAVPFTMSAIYLQAFFKNREIAPIYAVSLIPVLLFVPNGAAMYVMFLLAGFVAILMFTRFQRGWQQFLTAFVTFLVLALLFLAFYMMDLFSGNIISTLALLFLGSILTVCLYPLTFLFEKIFNLISVTRLVEMCDSSNPLLHELELKAPGTFQHSLQVMNMADAAARAVGAHVQLVRVGALYHDIGKICNPLCFVENESILSVEREGYHSRLTPAQSASDIIRHVTDGVLLAKKYGLPFIVPDFILSHHGTTTASYFFNKHLEAGGSPEDVTEFTYPGPRPFSKEQVILMLCDGIEAASRTLKDYSPDSFDKFVERMVASKLEDGQFENADISLSELGIIKQTLKNYLAQMYHARIEYPKEIKTKTTKIWKSKQKNQTR